MADLNTTSPQSAVAAPAPLLERADRRGGSLSRALRNPAYRRLWTAGVLIAFGNWMERLVVGWIVLDQTGSVFLTALTFAARQAPSLLFAPFAGAVADRIDRRRLLVIAPVSKAMFSVALAVTVAGNLDTVWPILAIVALSGVMRTLEHPATQTLITDIVGPKDSMTGISIYAVGARAVGLIGAMTGGVMIEAAGPVSVFATTGSVFVLGAAVVLFVKPPAARTGRPPGSVLGNTVEGLRVMAGLPTVASLLGLAVVVEILAFSYQSVTPAVARDVLHVGAMGLGAITTMAGVGSLIGSTLLALLGDYRQKGRLILSAALLYGVALVAFGSSGWFPLSLILVTGVGMMAAIFDALQWTLLQANVPDRMRGRAIGGWVFAIGFGWLGHLELGGLGETMGVQFAIVVNGVLLIVVSVLVFVFATKLRRA